MEILKNTVEDIKNHAALFASAAAMYADCEQKGNLLSAAAMRSHINEHGTAVSAGILSICRMVNGCDETSMDEIDSSIQAAVACQPVDGE